MTSDHRPYEKIERMPERPLPERSMAETLHSSAEMRPAPQPTAQPVTLRPIELAPVHTPTVAPAWQEEDHYLDDEGPEVQGKQPSSLIAREIIETFLLTLLIFWAVNTVTGRFRIEGSSMMPTMQEGEYILINKLAYYLDEPVRGDIIVLQYPRDPSRDFIKRIIGVPGDLVEIKDEIVYVNGNLLNEPYIDTPPRYSGSWTVPPDQFFVLGDNRNNSSDSHTWGFLPDDHIVGRGWVVYWPVKEWERVPHFSHLFPNSTQSGETGLVAATSDQ